MAAQVASLSRRKGETPRGKRMCPVYLLYVVLTGALVVFFVYVQAINELFHHANRHHHHGGIILNGGGTYQSQQEKTVDFQRKVGEAKRETLIMKLPIGVLKIQLRPDLSPSSIEYIHQIVESGKFSPCGLFRAEKPGILQGIMKDSTLGDKAVKVKLGDCPADITNPKGPCHGPTMTRGLVAWAGGSAGPDFFIDAYENPATWWGNEHTVWGEIVDPKSMAVVEKVWDLPVTKTNGLSYLNERLHFTLEIESS